MFKLFRLVYGGNYIGPGNRMDPAYIRYNPPVSLLDLYALEHDMTPNYDYFRFSKSDQKLIDRSKTLPGWRARTARAYFELKRVLAPHVDE